VALLNRRHACPQPVSGTRPDDFWIDETFSTQHQ
jgi:hypothetical protein